MRKGERPEASPAQRPVVPQPIEIASGAPRAADLVITDAMRSALGLIAPSGLQRQRAAEFRHIKRQIVADIQSNATRRLVMVTSALAGEGKTFTAANLAESLALEADYSVLLVDADVLKPRLTDSLGLRERMGLLDSVLDPQLNPESLVLTTDIQGLSVLPVGVRHENATEHFAGDRMRDVMRILLSVHNRIVLIDSLPLLQTTEARALAPLATQVLLVVRAESTSESAARASLELLGEGADVKVVLNAVVRTGLANYMGYGYGQGYGYDYGDTPTTTAAP